jgi:sulfoxide reductase heme-binding subunit YedZ
VIAAAGPSPLWYLTRGTGLVTLLLLTASVVLGVLQVRRWGSPRFVVVSLHRAVSLLVVALLAVHVATAVLDGFAPIRLLDAVLPFAGAYRPVWLGLGAVALDLLVALTVTSLLRRRLGLRAWRAVHWVAYGCWPVALVHGWGTGSDTRSAWMLAVTLACTAAVLAAVMWRLAGAPPDRAGVSAAVVSACLALVAVAALWLARGPLATGWARRAGTPPQLLASGAAASARVPTRRGRDAPLLHPFTARVRGELHQGLSARGTAVVDLRLRLSDGADGVLRIRIAGEPADGGGVIMRRSAVELGPRSRPTELSGRIVSLQDTSLEALVGSASGRAVRLHADLQLAPDSIDGTVTGRPVTG